ncbi:hypothetical protein BCS71_25620 [Vibrio lentus]|uniref:hypothetical protein n=1 Tax=Vibrio lentus TaxID=136468 RepID=UPI0013000AA6|nr:hypothetical protein [Vibrio lentus]
MAKAKAETVSKETPNLKEYTALIKFRFLGKSHEKDSTLMITEAQASILVITGKLKAIK